MTARPTKKTVALPTHITLPKIVLVTFTAAFLRVSHMPLLLPFDPLYRRTVS